MAPLTAQFRVARFSQKSLSADGGIDFFHHRERRERRWWWEGRFVRCPALGLAEGTEPDGIGFRNSAQAAGACDACSFGLQS